MRQIQTSRKFKKKNGLRHHSLRKWLRIFRGRAQPTKGVSSPTPDLYLTLLCRVKKEKENNNKNADQSCDPVEKQILKLRTN